MEADLKEALAASAGSEEWILCHHRWEKLYSFTTWSATSTGDVPTGMPTMSVFACIFCREERVLLDPPNSELNGKG